MSVPAEIRAVKRPKNTIVDDNGGTGPNRYSVRQRGVSKYVAGKNPQPHNGKVIGHIIDGKFVPITSKVAAAGPDILSYGASALVKAHSNDILQDLLEIYPPREAYEIMSIATLQIMKPHITARRMATHYQRSFVSIDYPGTPLSENTISKLYQKLGQDGEKRYEFYQKRIAKVAENHHIAIDGTLKTNSSIVNDLSAYSYKAKVKGSKDISILYAYDIELMEPVCAEVFPGNSIDATSYSSFIKDNNLSKGIIIADKGFPPSKIESELHNRPNLHFLTPIKRNDVRIQNNRMLEFQGVIARENGNILYKKQAIKGGRYLYAYKDPLKAGKEDIDYLSRLNKTTDFSLEKYDKKNSSFGVIVFESDLDLSPEVAYQCYNDRWLLELVFRQYKHDECLDKTGVQGDFSIIGKEFINFISTIATCRIIHTISKTGLFEKMTYGEIMDDLMSAWRRVDAPIQAATDDGYWVHTLNNVFEELETLGLSKAVKKPEPQKRGRKPNPDKIIKQKRPRGRPRKIQVL
jgi:hypothetical protein